MYPKPGKFLGLEDRSDNPDIRPLRDVSTGNHLRTDAANCFYPVYVKDQKVIGFGPVCDDLFHPSGTNVVNSEGVMEIYPIDAQGEERKWVFARNTVESIIDELTIEFNSSRKIWDVIRRKTRFNYKSVWTDKKYSANSYGSKVLNEMFGGQVFDYPKSIFTVRDCIDASLKNSNKGNDIIFDFFGGSGTTGHVVINMNREDGGDRKFILIEMGKHFDNVVVPRIKKAIYSKDWKGGKPVSHDTGISHAFKIIKLESYEDALKNLVITRTKEQNDALTDAGVAAKDEYLLGYFLDVETEGSTSLLNVEKFRDPFNYKMHIATDSAGETKETNVDLVETFNWLIGLKVKHMDFPKGFVTVTGEKRTGERTLVIWRTLGDDLKADNLALERVLKTLNVDPTDRSKFPEYDCIYINGSHSLQDPHKRIFLIEEEFQRRMFESESFESLG
jgi:adenine-specific DNA-methyltransferase